VLLGHTLLTIFFLTGFRHIIRSVHRELVKARFDLKRVLILGSKGDAAELAGRLTAYPELGIDVVGHIGEGGDSLGAVGDLEEIIERHRIQEVVILPSFHEEEPLLPFMVRSRGRMIQVRVISPLARFLGTGARVEEVAGLHSFTIERGFLLLAWCGLKRIADVIAALVCLPFVAILSLLCAIYGAISGAVTFSRERRIGSGGRVIGWPRAVTASGTESPDICKIMLWLYLLAGRLSLVGPPPPRIEWSAGIGERGGYRFRPGITGEWRLAHADTWQQATEDEILAMQNCSLTREVIILVRSLALLLKGTYPAWFHDERRKR
jgi:hypothetical protein